MAVQILNDMPDVAVHRGDPEPLPREPWPREPLLSDWSRPATRPANKPRTVFIASTIALHVLAVAAVMGMRYVSRPLETPAPIMASLIEAPEVTDEAPAPQAPPMTELQYTVPVPEVQIDTEPTAAPVMMVASLSEAPATSGAPPMVESVDYVRPPAPVYPRESSRRREQGTVLLRVLVDTAGKPAQIQIERSSGFERLDMAARQAVEKALFRPHEVNGVAQAAQVLIPIEFTRRAS